MSAEQEQINFFSETDFSLDNKKSHLLWLMRVIESEGKLIDEINFIFCDDEYLHKINLQYLDHDTYTDIISFDNSFEEELSGDIFISVERVRENSKKFGVSFEEELRRVLVHGILHFCGYKDKSESETALMRQKENEKIIMFHVEQ